MKDRPKPGNYSYADFQKIAFDKFKDLQKDYPGSSVPRLILQTALELKGLTWTRRNPNVLPTFEIRQMIEEKLGRKPGVGLISAWSK